MSRYDGLIIPRSYSEYINKTDAATLQQALQLSGVLSGAVAAGDNKAVTSNAVNNALADYQIAKKTMILTSVDLNTLIQDGQYFAGHDETGNGCTNKPENIIHSFYLEVLRGGSGTMFQIMITGTGTRYIRTSWNFGETWNNWLQE
jgi:hypothetical protein